MKSTKLYLKSGYCFKLRYSHSKLQLIHMSGNDYRLFRVRDNDGTVYVGSVTITYKYLNIEHEFEGLIFNDKYNIDDIQIIHPHKES